MENSEVCEAIVRMAAKVEIKETEKIVVIIEI